MNNTSSECHHECHDQRQRIRIALSKDLLAQLAHFKMTVVVAKFLQVFFVQLTAEVGLQTVDADEERVDPEVLD